MSLDNGSHEYNGSSAYCWDFNEQGFCKTCGATKTTLNGEWPQNTWFQRRRAELAVEALNDLSKVRS